MLQRSRHLICGLGPTILLGTSAPIGAFAHEHRDIGGRTYSLEVGSSTATPPAGEERGTLGKRRTQTVKARQVISGDQTMDLTWTADVKGPGISTSMFLPMAEGDYTFRIYGDIEGAAKGVDYLAIRSLLAHVKHARTRSL